MSKYTRVQKLVGNKYLAKCTLTVKDTSNKRSDSFDDFGISMQVFFPATRK